MDWRPYNACCTRLAAEADAGFCPECGHAFLRCAAFAECRSLVTPTGACPVCVAPALLIDAGAVVQSKAGDRLSVPLILRNSSPAGRPIWIKRIVRRDSRGDEALVLTWDRIEAGAERRFTIDTAPLEGGTHTLSVIIVVASRYRKLEEEYAFLASKMITASRADGDQTIIQNIEVSGTGGLVKADLDTPRSKEAQTGLQDRLALPLDRAEKYEIEQGIRGYREEGVRVPRHVEFAFNGFRADERPENGATAVVRGRLVCGRNSRTADPSAGIATDVSLRAYDPRTGKLDEPATMAISRHHFDLVAVNDRLSVQAHAGSGMQVNGERLESGDLSIVESGDRLVPIPGHPDKLTLQVAFATAMDTVERVTLSRIPPVKE